MKIKVTYIIPSKFLVSYDSVEHQTGSYSQIFCRLSIETPHLKKFDQDAECLRRKGKNELA